MADHSTGAVGDARKRQTAKPLAITICKNLHPLEWRDDDQGRVNPCARCWSTATAVAAEHLVISRAEVSRG